MIHLKHRDRHGGIWRDMEGSVIQGRNKWKHVKTKRIVHETRWEEMRRWKMFPSILEGFLSLPREGPICFRSLDFMVNEALISSECLWKIRFNMFKFCFYDVTWSLAEWFYNHITHNNICYIFLQMGSKQKMTTGCRRQGSGSFGEKAAVWAEEIRNFSPDLWLRFDLSCTFQHFGFIYKQPLRRAACW